MSNLKVQQSAESVRVLRINRQRLTRTLQRLGQVISQNINGCQVGIESALRLSIALDLLVRQGTIGRRLRKIFRIQMLLRILTPIQRQARLCRVGMRTVCHTKRQRWRYIVVVVVIANIVVIDSVWVVAGVGVLD